MLEAGTTCAVKSVLTSCGANATAQCVYCGRPFCDKHGEVMDDGYEVCTRKPCVTKKQDLAVHLLYKQSVLVRNRERLCGLEVCVEEFERQCRRCRGYFCRVHIRMSQEVVPEGEPSTECVHCQERRSIWDRD